MNYELLLAAFLVGLLGGVHCIGMCGGIVSALTSALDSTLRNSRVRFFTALLAYNTGRLLSYVAAGLLVGVFGQQVLQWVGPDGQLAARVLAAVIMILFGFYLAGWGHALLFLERAGVRLWKYIEPYGRRFLPVRGAGQAFCLGVVWGWLPCGMVYAVLALALSSSSTIGGGMVMLAFGLGTLPLMLSMGLAINRLGPVLQRPLTRQLAGMLVILLGITTLLANPSEHGHHSAPVHGAAHHPPQP